MCNSIPEKYKYLVLVGVALFSGIISAFAAEQVITSREAAQHIGERKTVCGKVVSTRFADHSRGQPTFLNIDRPYPRQIFTAVIWGSDRPRFGGAPETHYLRKDVCVSGTIRSYRGKPEIIVKNPRQIRLQ